jgi:MoaA/NifB/PqqE/SkfB family radical SAM enzyme
MRVYLREEHFGAIAFHARDGVYQMLGAEDAQALERTGRELVRIRNARAIPQALSAPLKAFFNVTRRCNLLCAHCYNDSGRPGSPELELAVVARTLEGLQRHGVMKVTLAGGEPLVHRDILGILEVAGGLDIDFSLITNGLPLSGPVLDAVVRTSPLRSVTVSLDGASAAENDAVRGRGTFERAIAGLRRLRARYDRKLAVRTTVMRTNAASLVQLPRLLREIGVSELKINRVNPYGRASGRDEILLPDHEFHRLGARLVEAAGALGIRVEVPANKYQVDPDGLLGLCRAGEETCEVDADGRVFPCSFSKGRFLAGSVKTDALEDVLLSLQRHSINNPYCYACRGRGGTREKPIGFVPQMVRRGNASQEVRT